ncbi:MAG: AGE family epimerase/isomerase [Bryobacterales bacterium]|nr:AGE family epimerase/isomerase [Bryobacterales bacterium]
MRRILQLLVTGLLFVTSCFSQFAPAEWLNHLNQELMPFWNHPGAFGDPKGDFPAIRCDDGTAVVWTSPCPEVGRNAWLMQRPRNVVSQSRQVYVYGVAYHMTGNPEYLRMMKLGVDYLRSQVMDRVNGGIATNQDARTGAWGPKMEWRNPQELAYGVLGLAMYYYLTRDAEVLPDIIAVKDHVFARYYDRDAHVIHWLLEDNGSERAAQRRLVAQLDQMNAYLVLMTPILPEPLRTQWRDDLEGISLLMIEKFYSPAENLFFLNANTPNDRDLAFAGTDFGHTIKAFWMIRWTAWMRGDVDLLAFAEANGKRVLERAYLAESGSWASAIRRGGELDRSKSWWIYAELDQFAATLSIKDPLMRTKYLAGTYDFWRKYMVDPNFGEVWSTVDGDTFLPVGDLPKQWPWKNGYHSLEHALIAYITGAAAEGQPLTLHYGFAVDRRQEDVHPYFFHGRIANVQAMSGSWAVTFLDVE